MTGNSNLPSRSNGIIRERYEGSFEQPPEVRVDFGDYTTMIPCNFGGECRWVRKYRVDGDPVRLYREVDGRLVQDPPHKVGPSNITF